MGFQAKLQMPSLLMAWQNSRKEYVKSRRRGWTVKCTAEGIERGLLMEKGRGEGKIIVPERFKVVALMAFVMCLCNADRVVMSVAIVPLASKNGWSSSFLGVVQVLQLSFTFPHIFRFSFFFCRLIWEYIFSWCAAE